MIRNSILQVPVWLASEKPEEKRLLLDVTPTNLVIAVLKFTKY